MNPMDWPDISVYHEGTRRSKEIRKSLSRVEGSKSSSLFQARDGSFWILDSKGKSPVRHLIRVADPETWKKLDRSALEKAYLLEARGGVSAEICVWAGCSNRRLKESAFCLDYTFEVGVRE